MSRSRDGGGRSVRSFFTNWSTYEGSFGTKLRLTARNRFRAVFLLKGCCGHPGEPGC
jgi:hypothetical protein